MTDWTYEDLAGMIDHSLLNPAIAPAGLERGCRLAAAYRTASVCVVPWFVRRAAAVLDGTGTAVGTTVGFPHGANAAAVKAAEAETALADGATELDMVINISRALGGDFAAVGREVGTLCRIAHAAGAALKVIFENCYLDDEARKALCRLCADAGVDWVKTSTGFGTGGAVDDDLRLMRAAVPPAVGVKAAGGVRTLDRLLEVRALGCGRAGATATAVILDEARIRLGLAPIADSRGPGQGGS